MCILFLRGLPEGKKKDARSPKKPSQRSHQQHLPTPDRALCTDGDTVTVSLSNSQTVFTDCCRFAINCKIKCKHKTLCFTVFLNIVSWYKYFWMTLNVLSCNTVFLLKCLWNKMPKKFIFKAVVTHMTYNMYYPQRTGEDYLSYD